MHTLENAAIALALPQERSIDALLEKYARAGEHRAADVVAARSA